MRAVVVEQFKGQPKILDVAKPVPRPDQILVEVAAAGLNPFDWQVADGAMPGMPAVFPFVIGGDASGIVVGIGDAVANFKLGDRVFGSFFHAPLGEGTYAEFALAPASAAIALLPATVSDEIGAALPTAAMTAMALVDRIDAGAGATVLVVGATGGVGSFATQLAALKGFEVLVTARAADADRMRGLGATRAFDHHQGELVAQIAAAFPDGVDAVLDLVSAPAPLATLSACVRRGGVVLSTTGSADDSDLRQRGLRGGNFVLDGQASLLMRLIELVEAGRLAVPIEATIGLEDVPAALARSRSGGARGKTVIKP